jgi:ParB-like chromosome segregation protein Spo0J
MYSSSTFLNKADLKKLGSEVNIIYLGGRKMILKEFMGVIQKIKNKNFNTQELMQLINQMRQELHSISPMKEEPVDCVIWVDSNKVIANDYNPNAVAPPEMELLKHSILQDGYTQPIVTWRHNDVSEVVDGFHRNRVGKETEEIRNRTHGYLPIVQINTARENRSDRISATIRHNRARGKHKIEGMSNIVIELKKRNWSDKKIGKELGMEPDEVLRLCQITGLAEMFKDKEFSEAWEAEITQEKDTGEMDII